MRVYMTNSAPHRVELVLDGVPAARRRELLDGVDQVGLPKVEPVIGNVAIMAATQEEVAQLEAVPGLHMMTDWAERI